MSDLTLDQAKARIARVGRAQKGENIISGPPKMQRACCFDCSHYRPHTPNDAHALCEKSRTPVSWFTPTCQSFRRR